MPGGKHHSRGQPIDFKYLLLKQIDRCLSSYGTTMWYNVNMLERLLTTYKDGPTAERINAIRQDYDRQIEGKENTRSISTDRDNRMYNKVIEMSVFKLEQAKHEKIFERLILLADKCGLIPERRVEFDITDEHLSKEDFEAKYARPSAD